MTVEVPVGPHARSTLMFQMYARPVPSTPSASSEPTMVQSRSTGERASHGVSTSITTAETPIERKANVAGAIGRWLRKRRWYPNVKP